MEKGVATQYAVDDALGVHVHQSQNTARQDILDFVLRESSNLLQKGRNRIEPAVLHNDLP